VTTTLDSIRLDKWLWAARFYKTRTLAAEAITGGKVHVNNQRSKAGKEIRVGTIITLSKDNLRWEITVTALSAQRRAAKEAVLLYSESPESITKRQAQRAIEREQRELVPFSLRCYKPNKKERRLIHQFKQKE
jgi:ribosome-associated heat shock protein Hsp15